MDTNSYFKSFPETAVYPHSYVFPIVRKIHRPNNPFINARLSHNTPEYRMRHPVKKSQVDALLNKVPLLHSTKDAYRDCSTAPRQKTKLHIINVNLGVNTL